MSFNSTMASREVCDLIFVDYSTKKPFLNLDFANTSTTELTGESVFAFGGKGHPKRVSFAGEKGGTLTIETQMQSVKLWQLITGGNMKSDAKYVSREILTVTSGAVTLPAAPAAGSITNVYAVSDDCGTELTSTVAGSKVTITGTNDGDEVIVYYTKAVTDKVQRVNIKSTSFPKAFTVYGDTYMKSSDDDILPYKMVAYKCVPQAQMSLSFANNGDPASITITADLMADRNNDLLDLILEEEA